MNNHVLDKCIDLILVLNLILILRRSHQSRPEANREIVSRHHVLIGVLGEMVQEGEEITHDANDRSGKCLEELPDPSHHFLLRLVLSERDEVIEVDGWEQRFAQLTQIQLEDTGDGVDV